MQTELSRVYEYRMPIPDFLARSREIWRATRGQWWRPKTHADMLVWLDEASYRAKQLGKHHRELFGHWLADWAEHLLWQKGEYARLRQGDPGAFYIPAHAVAEAFHQSLAFVKLFVAGNRCAKTQSAYQETYWIVTNQHPWGFPELPKRNQSVAVVGTTYQKYSKDVFGVKMVEGEAGNELAPYFPEGGKWLRYFDRKGYRVHTACPVCAAKGTAETCPPTHTGRGTTSLYSDKGGPAAIMGSQFTRIHLDEHLAFGFYKEGIQRLGTVSHSSMAITGSPLYGTGVWEHQIVEKRAKAPAHQNRRGDNPDAPYAAYFQISQYDAGLRPKADIDADARDMSEGEVQARIYGVPTALAENPVLDRTMIDTQRQIAREISWVSGRLEMDLKEMIANDVDQAIAEIQTVEPLRFVQDPEAGRIALLEKPQRSGQYIIGVDTADDLTDTGGAELGDFSCAKVWKMEDDGGWIKLTNVAEWHGHLNPQEYDQEVKKLGIWYNYAWLVIETTGGLGQGVLWRLRNQYFYGKIWADDGDARKAGEVNPVARLGLDTNQSTKPLMIGALQQMWKSGRLVSHHEPTLDEYQAYNRTRKESGRIVYEAAAGGHDDRVMASALPCYAVMKSAAALFDWTKYEENKEPDRSARKPDEPEAVGIYSRRRRQEHEPWNPWEEIKP